MSTDTTIDMTRGQYRKVYAGFLTGDRINAVSMQAEAFFWRLLMVVDDYGNYHADARLVRNACCGYREWMTADVQQWLGELRHVGLIADYQDGRDEYIHIVGFKDFQPAGRNGKRAAKFPIHPDSADAIQVYPGESMVIQGDPVSLCNSVQHQDQDQNQDQDQDQISDAGAPRLNGNGAHAGKSKGKKPSKPRVERSTAFWRFWNAVPKNRRNGIDDAWAFWQAENLDERADEILAEWEREKARGEHCISADKFLLNYRWVTSGNEGAGGAWRDFDWPAHVTLDRAALDATAGTDGRGLLLRLAWSEARRSSKTQPTPPGWTTRPVDVAECERALDDLLQHVSLDVVRRNYVEFLQNPECPFGADNALATLKTLPMFVRHYAAIDAWTKEKREQ